MPTGCKGTHLAPRGRGIPPHATKRNGKGTGVGLTVSYGIPERHGGTIHVISCAHSGTTFTISLRRHLAERLPAYSTTTTTGV
ncbi:MAG TPA: ATP-binding protein [Bacteroidota bacterium]|nr:ATP-binding protein [Bacteroidota bacterium]